MEKSIKIRRNASRAVGTVVRDTSSLERSVGRTHDWFAERDLRNQAIIFDSLFAFH